MLFALVWGLGNMLLTGCGLFRGELRWRAPEAEVFAEAREDGRLILLHLDAAWDAGSTAMDAAYADEDVGRLVSEGMLPVRASAAQRPDLAAHFAPARWPLTAVLDAEGAELAVRHGALSPAELATLLRELLDGAGPRAEVRLPLRRPGRRPVDAELRDRLAAASLDRFDSENAGWGFGAKSLERAPLEMALRRAQRGGDGDRGRAMVTLRRALALMDPVWGGMVRESESPSWDRPRSEKLLRTQADAVLLYAWAHADSEPEWADEAVAEVLRYTDRFLEGAGGGLRESQARPTRGARPFFERSEEERRSDGIPAVSELCTAASAGHMVSALCWASGWLMQAALQRRAEELGEWLWFSRRRPDGLFARTAERSGPAFLIDTLRAVEAFLDLAESGADDRWTWRALQTARALDGRFESLTRSGEPAGYLSVDGGFGPLRMLPDREENCLAARGLGRLASWTLDEGVRAAADRALAFLVAPEVAGVGPPEHVWLAVDELRTAPLRILIVGRDGARAEDMMAQARRVPARHRLLARWDPERGHAPWPGVEDFGVPGDDRPVTYLWAGSSAVAVLDAADVLDAARRCLRELPP